MRGFTFEQLAVILLVVLGLVIVVVLFISQIGKASSGLGGVSDTINSSTSSIGAQPICASQGGKCTIKDSCKTKNLTSDFDCSSLTTATNTYWCCAK